MSLDSTSSISMEVKNGTKNLSGNCCESSFQSLLQCDLHNIHTGGTIASIVILINAAVILIIIAVTAAVYAKYKNRKRAQSFNNNKGCVTTCTWT